MSKASAQRPSAISHLISSFELPATKRFYLSVVCLILKRQEFVVDTMDAETYEYLRFAGYFALVSSSALVATVIYSYKKGGFKEIIENLLLWFLLSIGCFKVSVPPVSPNDEIVGGLFFLAFGFCRIAKHFSIKSNA